MVSPFQAAAIDSFSPRSTGRTRSLEKLVISIFSYLRELRALRGELFLSELCAHCAFAGDIPKFGSTFTLLRRVQFLVL
jgi:hypothetical protein